MALPSGSRLEELFPNGHENFDFASRPDVDTAEIINAGHRT
jgi:hypothetical protein